MMQELDARQQLMVITMEECGELQQVCSKILRQATVENKRQELVDAASTPGAEPVGEVLQVDVGLLRDNVTRHLFAQ